MKVNELFDDDLQSKSGLKIPSKSELLDIIKSNESTKNPVNKFVKKLVYEITPLYSCLLAEDKNHFYAKTFSEEVKVYVLNFVIRNESIHTSVSLYFISPTIVSMCIFYQRNGYRGDVTIRDLTTGEMEFSYLEDFEEINLTTAVDILKNKYLPLLKRFNFEDYKISNSIKQQRFN